MNAGVEAYVKECLQEIAEQKGLEVGMAEVGEQDHIHVFASAHPMELIRTFFITY